MKLHAIIKNERGGQKSTSDDKRIQVDLHYKNEVLGTLGLYAIENNAGYRLIWRATGTGFGQEVILSEKEKAKATGNIWDTMEKDFPKGFKK